MTRRRQRGEIRQRTENDNFFRKLQIPSFKIKSRTRAVLKFGSLKFPWSLDVGAWCFTRVVSSPNQPGDESGGRAAKMGKGGNGADARDLFPGPNDLKQNPQNQREPGR